MYDIHCHLIYGVDDGSVDIESSLELIKLAFNNGYKGLVLTPHYVEDSNFSSKASFNKEVLNTLKKSIDYDISLYLGNEVYFSRNIMSLLESNLISTLNNSRYLLMELSILNQDKNVLDMIDILRSKGITPIIAHPERYSYLLSDLSLMVEMVEHGALFQVNIGSVVGLHGRKTKRHAIKLLKSNLVHFLSSDTHSSNNYKYTKEALDIVNNINPTLGELLLTINPLKVINDEVIIPTNPVIRKWFNI
jgi:protein-tyrosine phosphatase